MAHVLHIVVLVLAIWLAIDAVFVAVVVRYADACERRRAQHDELLADLEAAEEKPYAVIGGAHRGPGQVAR